VDYFYYLDISQDNIYTKKINKMKKLLTTILLLLTFISSNAQENEKKDRTEIISAPVLICSNLERDKWFAIIPTFEKFDGVVVKTYLTTLKTNIGDCTKDDALVFIFTDGRKIKVNANNEKRCDGIVEVKFVLNSIDAAFLESKTLESIRYINGNDFVSFIYFSKKEDCNYFVNTFGNYRR
jgi:hypothetical protein